jgi:putative DNA-invertase from lambdoid prophage Rac
MFCNTGKEDGMAITVGYVRRSRERGNGAFSLEDQEGRIQAWADYRDRAIERIIREDDVSGALAPGDRPELGPALESLGEGDTLVVARLDRLSRSVWDFVNLLRRSRSEGWVLVCLEPEFDLATASGRLVANVFASFAEFQKDQIVEQLHGARRRKAAQGGYIGGRTVPFGYRVEDGTFVEEPGEQEVIRQIMSLRREGRTWKQVGAALDMHPNTVKKVYYRETGEPHSRVHKGLAAA